MQLSLRFNACIDRINILEKPTACIGEFLENHPTIYKITLIINHLFRAAMMVGLMFIPGVPLYASMPVCFVGSLFYRLTVEKNCTYKFALPAFAGAAAFMLALPALISMINGVAFATVASGFAACASFLPLLLYGTYIFLTVNHDVNQKLGLVKTNDVEPQGENKPCQEKEECQCHAMQQNE
jgi:hypothetical protein